jgi:predicted PurR-regulated permease PerM
MLKPYIYPIFWAAVIASIFYPVQKILVIKLSNRKTLATVITMLLVFLIVLIPLVGVASLVVKQSIDIYQDFGNKDTLNNISASIQHYLEYPLVNKLAGDINVRDYIIKWSSSITGFVYQVIATASQNTVKFFIQFFIMLYSLFFFIKEGDVLLKKIMYLLPLGDRYEKMIYDRFVSTARATIKGVLLIGVIQGALAGIVLYIAGVPGSAFWSVVMMLLCMIPSLGAFIILLPSGIILLIMGHIWQGIFVLICMLIIGTMDNFIRGPLIGKDAKMHPLFIFFSTLGGLLTFGLTGVIIGPVITAFLLSMWTIYAEKYKTDLAKAD